MLFVVVFFQQSTGECSERSRFVYAGSIDVTVEEGRKMMWKREKNKVEV